MSEKLWPGLHSTAQLSAPDLQALLALASLGKESNWQAFHQALQYRVIGLLFFNPSLRTRVSFQSGIARLGGTAVALSPGSDTWKLEFEDNVVMNGDRSEHVQEAAKVLSTYCDALCVRSFPEMRSWEEDRQDTVVSAFARHAMVPVVNLESGLFHPCQALADAMTLKERFGDDLRGKVFVLSWAPHPKQLPMAVPNSAALIAAQLGMEVRIACPEGYELDPEITSLVQAKCAETGSSLSIQHSQHEAFRGADVVYGKSWTPPGFIGRAEEELQFRKSLASWRIESQQMALTNQAIFMHCLPVRRNVVVSDAVLDSAQSVIYQQAGNRMHVQNALLMRLLGV